MRINKLHLKNFKGFAERIFEFSRRSNALSDGNGSFHLIIGQNATGKTALLDALAVAAGSWFLGIPSAKERAILPSDIRTKVFHYNDTDRIEQLLPVIVDAEGVISGVPIRWKRELHKRRTTSTLAKEIRIIAQQTILKMQGESDTTLPLISYYGTKRLWDEPNFTRNFEDQKIKNQRNIQSEYKGIENRFSSRLSGYRYSVDARISQRELIHWLRFEKIMALENGRESQQFTTVKEAIQKSIERCSNADFHIRLGLLLDIEDQGKLPFWALSDGQRAMVTMIGDIAFKAAQLNPHLGSESLQKTPGIILIDELDLHLHPRWQRHIVDDLQKIFPEIQFICTTHSPQIIGEVSAEEIIVLGTGSQTYKLNYAFGLDSNRVLSELMDAPIRNKDIEAKINELFKSIDDEEFDSAKEQIRDIENKIGDDDTELIRAKSIMAFINNIWNEDNH